MLPPAKKKKLFIFLKKKKKNKTIGWYLKFQKPYILNESLSDLE